MAEILGSGIKWEQLADVTDIPADTYYYPDVGGMRFTGFDDLSIGMVCSGGVIVTIEASQDSINEDSPSWLDITKAGFDVVKNKDNNANYTNESTTVDFDNLNAMKFRVKAVTSDATNSIKLSCRMKSNDR